MSYRVLELNEVSKKFLIHHKVDKSNYNSFGELITQKAKIIFSSNKNRPTLVKEEFWALSDISFSVNKGERIGIIGRNGAGKSTLLKLLSRITEPTRGVISIKGKVASLLEVGTGFHPELTGRENIYLNGVILGMSRVDIRDKFDEIVQFAEIEQFLDTPVKRYSSGMYVRLAFAVAAHLQPDILIVDEVLAVGDSSFQKKCLGKIEDVSKNYGRTVLFVSHNMSVVASLCDKALYLKGGRVSSFGDVQKVMSLYVNEGHNNKVKFEKYLSDFTVEQVGDFILIKAFYESDRYLDIPHLGIVIKNSFGIPICGISPTIDQLEINKSKKLYKKGEIELKLEYPKLLDGTYSISIWFGNSSENFLVSEDCVTFEIVGMSNKKQLSPTIVGNVFPKANWSFREH